MIPLKRFSTTHLPEEARLQAWLERDWPRVDRVYRTVPLEPFDVVMEHAALARTVLVRTEISAMIWERHPDDIRASDMNAIIVSMMVRGRAHGDLDGRPFLEPAGTYHFHDLSRPSLHTSTASLTYGLMLPRDVVEGMGVPIDDLHGLVVDGPAAGALLNLAGTVWSWLPDMTTDGAARAEAAMLELLVAGIHQALPGAPARARRDALRDAAIAEIDHSLGLSATTVAKLARILAVPVEQIVSAFRGDGGLAAYLLSRRLEEARSALADRGRQEPIGDIAHRLGFSDAAHLSRAFRKRFGVSPRDYRSDRRAAAGRGDDGTA
ncbi:MAG TPA: helix-turn-helix transcriptional regulator [Brevundimonas sp.]|uniref:helix-turn-helix transcriptional regulator n=1 Tax=Brevundimonas sp. TaxID=1871086 RepID=UPI002DE9A60D|nr:helix-turn-helix transcriptional regulator [Brevundimonas sp.]